MTSVVREREAEEAAGHEQQTLRRSERAGVGVRVNPVAR